MINFNIHPAPFLKCLLITFKASSPPHRPASQGTPRHRSNLSGINVIHNPPCLHSTPDWLHSGQFPFYPADISGLRSHLFRCIRIGNSILCQSLLSSQHRQTFRICIQTEGEGDCTSVGEHVFVGECSAVACIHAHSRFLFIFKSSFPSTFDCFLSILSSFVVGIWFLSVLPQFSPLCFSFHLVSLSTVKPPPRRWLFRLQPHHPSILLCSDGVNL